MAVGGSDDTVAGTLHGVAAPKGLGPIDPGAQPIAGRYEIVRLLGGGGMGRVYEAIDGELGERVALKVLHGGLTEEALERFRREVRLTRKIQHRNVARMFDIGDHAGEKFLTMELVEGETLARVLGGRPLEWRRLRGAALQITAGLAAAHACGVIHRDLKPDNVLVELATGRYVITDFGIARGGDDPNVTQVGAVVGTPRYMAPEQLAGRDTDARADLFSLGVMFYEMAAGHRPWDGDNAIAIAVAQATQPARPLDQHSAPAFGGAARSGGAGPSDRPDLPREFVALVMQCLAIDPGERPASAQAVVDQITEISDTGRPTPPVGVSTLAAASASAISLSRLAAVAAPTTTTMAFHPTVETSLAVLPVSCAANDAYLADGIQEDLVDTLSTMPHVKVRPAGIARGGAEHDVRALGKQLAVEQVVTASLRRTPTGLRVSARMISVADGFQIWAHRADCTEAEVLAQSEVLARGIAAALSSRATAATRPTDPRAVDLYLRARAELRQFWGKHAVAAVELLTEAAALAPESPPILGALAYASVQAWVMVADETLLVPAVAAVERALHYGHGEAFLASAILKVNSDDTLGGAADLRTALARAPMSAQTHEYVGKILVELGPVDEARHHFETAIGLDPGRAALITSDLARLDALLGDLPAAHARLAQLAASPDASLQQLGAVFHARLQGWIGQRDPLMSAASRLATRFGGNMIRMIEIVHASHDDATVDRRAWDTHATAFVVEPRPRRLMILGLQLLAESAAVCRADELVFSACDYACRLGLLDIVWFDRLPLFARFRTDLRWLEIRSRIAARSDAMLAALRG